MVEIDSYCSKCSIEPTDLRKLKVTDTSITCTHCKNILYFKQATRKGKKIPYYCLVEEEPDDE